MAEPFLGEIRIFGGTYAPAGWAFCNGQSFAISENTDLYGLIGSTYGGDGQTTFAVPDLRGRVPLHFGQAGSGSSYKLGDKGGTEQVTITGVQMPVHTHAPQCFAGNGSSTDPTNNFWAAQPALLPYSIGPATSNMGPGILLSSGGNEPHENMIPFCGVHYIISLFGAFPTQQ